MTIKLYQFDFIEIVIHRTRYWLYIDTHYEDDSIAYVSFIYFKIKYLPIKEFSF